MAETNIFKYSTNERLGKMDVDIIDIDLVTDTDSTADNGVISNPVEIMEQMPQGRVQVRQAGLS